MLRKDVKVINQLGLHARAAAQLVRLAGTFESKIKIIRKESQIYADAKSILSVLTLAASKGTDLIIEVEGADEGIALEKVLELFSEGFGEL